MPVTFLQLQNSSLVLHSYSNRWTLLFCITYPARMFFICGCTSKFLEYRTRCNSFCGRNVLDGFSNLVRRWPNFGPATCQRRGIAKSDFHILLLDVVFLSYWRKYWDRSVLRNMEYWYINSKEYTQNRPIELIRSCSSFPCLLFVG